MGRHQSAVVLTAPAVRHPFQRKVLCLYLLSVQHNARLDTVSRIVAAGRGQTQPRTPLIRIPERHHTLPVPSAYSRISDSALHVCRPHSCQLGTAHRLGVMAHRSINDGVHRHSIRSVSRTP